MGRKQTCDYHTRKPFITTYIQCQKEKLGKPEDGGIKLTK